MQQLYSNSNLFFIVVQQIQEFKITGLVIGYPLELTGFQGKQVCCLWFLCHAVYASFLIYKSSDWALPKIATFQLFKN